MSIKIRLPTLAIASTALMSMVLRRLLSLELHQRQAPPMRTQEEIRRLPLCDRARGALMATAPRAIEKRTLHFIGNNAIKKVYRSIFASKCPVELLSGKRCLRAEQKATLQFGRLLLRLQLKAKAAEKAAEKAARETARATKAAEKAAQEEKARAREAEREAEKGDEGGGEGGGEGGAGGEGEGSRGGARGGARGDDRVGERAERGEGGEGGGGEGARLGEGGGEGARPAGEGGGGEGARPEAAGGVRPVVVAGVGGGCVCARRLVDSAPQAVRRLP